MAYSDIQARIASDLRRDDLSADIQNAINDAIKFWEGESLKFNERFYVIMTKAGQEYYSLSYQLLPSNQFPLSQNVATLPVLVDGSALGNGEAILEIETMTCKPLSTGLPYPVVSRSMAWFDKNQANPSVAQGLPEFYGEFASGMRIYPVPNNVHTLTLATTARLAPFPLQNNSDTNAWLVEGEGLIREQAKAFIYRDIIRDAEGYQNCLAAIHGDDGGSVYIPGHLYSLKRKGSAETVGRVEAWSL